MATPVMASAQAAPLQPPSKDVVVVGSVPPHTTEQRVVSFAAELSQGSGYDQLARWRNNNPVCVKVVGLIPVADQAIRAAVQDEAKRLHLIVQSDPCNANVIVIGTDNPLKAMAAIEKVMGSLANEEGAAAERRELSKPAPVHWWRVRHRGVADGRESVDPNGQPGKTLAGPQNNVYDSSHLRLDSRENVENVVVLVEGSKVGGATAEALGEYVAMGVFATFPSPPPVPSSPSILALYKPEGGAVPGAPGRMTDWDRAYLKGLYDMDPSEQSTLQKGHIYTVMMRELDKPEPGAASTPHNR